MTTGRHSRRNATIRQATARRGHRENNVFLGVVGFSLAIHIIVATIFLHNPTAAIQRRPPTLSVDLVMAPVANPQRGSAGAVKKAVAPVATEKVPPLPAKAPKETIVLKGKEIKKTPAAQDDGVAADIAKMKQRLADKAEEKNAQNAIADMRKKKTPASEATAAVGSSNGTGNKPGSAIDAWLQKEVKAKWNLPGRKRKDLSAEVEVEFDAAGKLSNYRFIRFSGEALFDKSLKDALLKLEPLPKTMREPYKNTILFNLDELQGQ